MQQQIDFVTQLCIYIKLDLQNSAVFQIPYVIFGTFFVIVAFMSKVWVKCSIFRFNCGLMLNVLSNLSYIPSQSASSRSGCGR